MCCVHPFNFDVASWNFESMQSMNYDKIFFCYWAIDSDMNVDPECHMKLLSFWWNLKQCLNYSVIELDKKLIGQEFCMYILYET